MNGSDTEDRLAWWPEANCGWPGAKRLIHDTFLFCHVYPRDLAEKPLDESDPESLTAHWLVNGDDRARRLLAQYVPRHLKSVEEIPAEWGRFLRELRGDAELGR